MDTRKEVKSIRAEDLTPEQREKWLYDLPVVADGSEQYFASIFFRYDNPFRQAIITAFDELANGEK